MTVTLKIPRIKTKASKIKELQTAIAKNAIIYTVCIEKITMLNDEASPLGYDPKWREAAITGIHDLHEVEPWMRPNAYIGERLKLVAAGATALDAMKNAREAINKLKG